MTNYQLSSAGVELIREFEGLRLEAYQCQAGVWTIGYGHTRGVKRGMKITAQQAETLLRGDMLPVAKWVNGLNVAKSQNEFDALVVFGFNCKLSALQRSTLMEYIRMGKTEAEIRGQWMRWNKVLDPRTGHYIESRGLTRRRKAEADLYFKK